MNTCIHRANQGENMATSVRLPEDTEKRLSALALKTGRSKAFYIREAILEHISELEDIYLAEARLEDLKAGRSKTFSIDDVEQELGLGN